MTTDYSGWTITVHPDKFAGVTGGTYTVIRYAAAVESDRFSGDDTCDMCSANGPQPAVYVVPDYILDEDTRERSDALLCQDHAQYLAATFTPKDSGETWTPPVESDPMEEAYTEHVTELDLYGLMDELQNATRRNSYGSHDRQIKIIRDEFSVRYDR